MVQKIEPAESTELEQIRQAQTGNQEALSILIEAYWPGVQRYLLRMTGNQDLAADLAQETFFRVYRQLAKLKEPQLFKSWVYKIATNLAISHSRQRKWFSLENLLHKSASKAEQVCETDEASRTNPLAYSLAAEKSRKVVASLNKLELEQRVLLLLRFYHDFSVEEISQILNIKPNAVHARLRRARLSFQRIYQD